MLFNNLVSAIWFWPKTSHICIKKFTKSTLIAHGIFLSFSSPSNSFRSDNLLVYCGITPVATCTGQKCCPWFTRGCMNCWVLFWVWLTFWGKFWRWTSTRPSVSLTVLTVMFFISPKTRSKLNSLLRVLIARVHMIMFILNWPSTMRVSLTCLKPNLQWPVFEYWKHVLFDFLVGGREGPEPETFAKECR